MKKILLRYCLAVACMMVVASCGDAPTRESLEPAADTTLPGTTEIAGDSTVYDSEYVTMYVVVIDTSRNYDELQEKMYEIGKLTNIEIDTMGRHYDRQKDDIVLDDDNEDEMYRGEYYPRRVEGIGLSIEHYILYDTVKDGPNPKVLIAALFEHRKSADSILAIVKPHAMNAHINETSMYMGCLH